MHALWIASGIVLWAVHFLFVYAFTGLACARGWDGAVPWTVAIASLVAAMAAGAIVALGLRQRTEFIAWMTAAVAAMALLAIAWEGLAVLFVEPCGLR